MFSKRRIRDFVYMDIERVRSYVAQLSGGLASERTTGAEHQSGIQGSIEGSIPLLSKATGEADYRYARSHSETKSLHDHIFAEFYEGIQSTDAFVVLNDASKFMWSEANFIDGNFILAQGALRFVDYHYTFELMKNIPALMEFANKFPTINGDEQKQRDARPQPTISDFKKLPIKQIGAFVEQFYSSQHVRVKLYPSGYSQPKVLVGNGDKGCFRSPPLELLKLYGPLIDAEWYCLAQINKGASSRPKRFTASTGNQIEDAFESMFDQLSELTDLLYGVQFPAVAMTPIAIYREM